MRGRRARAGARILAVLALLAGGLGLIGPAQGPQPDPVSWISRCGLRLCESGHPWALTMGTIYGGLSRPTAAVAEVAALGLDTVRITDFLDVDESPAAAAADSADLARVDRVIAAAGAAGLHVELDLSAYRNVLRADGGDPYTDDWTPFLLSLVDRQNTVTHVRYGDDPTIALVSFAGEVDAVTGTANTYGLTTADLTRFYGRVESVWHLQAPRQLLTAGGLTQLYPGSGIDWRAIFALPTNDVDAIHVYSALDRDRTLPAVAAYSARIGRPWITEEFGFPAAVGDRERAVGFARIFGLDQRFGAAGTGFWNVGRQTRGTYDVGPAFPATFGVVRRWALAAAPEP